MVDFLAESWRRDEDWPAVAARLRECVIYADAMRGAKRIYVEALVHPDSGATSGTLLGSRLGAVSVHGYFSSVPLPTDPRRYVTPTAILEARALSHVLLHIRRVLGGGELADGEVRRYWRTFYGKLTAPEYTFEVDLLAGVFHQPSFDALLENHRGAQLDQLLRITTGLCWFALHAVPGGSAYNADPVGRLLVGVRETEQHALERRATAPSMADYLAAIDARDGERPEPRGFLTADENIALSIELIHGALTDLEQSPEQGALERHFAALLTATVRQLGRRRGQGYASRLGLPEAGNPFFGIDDDQDAEDLLPEHRPAPAVREWFALREHVLFKLVPSAEEKTRLLAQMLVGAPKTAH